VELIQQLMSQRVSVGFEEILLRTADAARNRVVQRVQYPDKLIRAAGLTDKTAKLKPLCATGGAEMEKSTECRRVAGLEADKEEKGLRRCVCGTARECAGKGQAAAYIQ